MLYCCKNKNPNLLLLLEALFIKFNRPELNNGLKASKEQKLFLYYMVFLSGKQSLAVAF